MWGLVRMWKIVVAMTEEVVSLAAEMTLRASWVMRVIVFSSSEREELRIEWKMELGWFSDVVGREEENSSVFARYRAKISVIWTRTS